MVEVRVQVDDVQLAPGSAIAVHSADYNDNSARRELAGRYSSGHSKILAAIMELQWPGHRKFPCPSRVLPLSIAKATWKYFLSWGR